MTNYSNVVFDLLLQGKLNYNSDETKSYVYELVRHLEANMITRSEAQEIATRPGFFDLKKYFNNQYQHYKERYSKISPEHPQYVNSRNLSKIFDCIDAYAFGELKIKDGNNVAKEYVANLTSLREDKFLIPKGPRDDFNLRGSRFLKNVIEDSINFFERINPHKRDITAELRTILDFGNNKQLGSGPGF